MTTSLTLVPSAGVVPFDASILAGQLAPSSIDKYRRTFGEYLRFAGHPDRALQATTLVAWRTQLSEHTSLSPNTINNRLAAVKRLIKEAANHGYIGHEVAQAFERVDGVKPGALKLRTRQHARTKITPADMRRLCSLPDGTTLMGARDAALLATMASSGLRVAEVASLTLAQIVKRDGGYLVSVRGKNDVDYREAPLSREACELIYKWVGCRRLESPYIFTSFHGRARRPSASALDPSSVWRIVQGYAQACGLEHIKPHDFRRFVGTQLAKDDIRKAQKALGHKRIDTTARHYVLDELAPGLTDNLY